MPKVTVKYDLTDVDDKMEHQRAMKSTDMAIMLWELLHNTKKELEHELDSRDSSSSAEYHILDKVFERIHQLAEQHGIIIDDLIV